MSWLPWGCAPEWGQTGRVTCSWECREWLVLVVELGAGLVLVTSVTAVGDTGGAEGL